MDNKQKLVGKRFGRLVVTSYNEEESNKLRGKSKYKNHFGTVNVIVVKKQL